MSCPSDPRTSRRPIGPSSPMCRDGFPRRYLAGGRSDRAGRCPSRVWITKMPASRQAFSTRSAAGRASSRSEVSLPSDSPKPPGYTKSRWKSIITSAVFLGSNSKSYGSALMVAMCVGNLLLADRCGCRVGDDPRPRLARECSFQARRRGDQDLWSAVLQERDGCLDLRAHASPREFALLQVPARFRDRQPIEEAFVRLPEADRHTLNAGARDA